MSSNGTSLASLAALLRDGENVIAPHVGDSDEEPALGALAAAGPRAAEAPEEYLLLVEAIREGYLLHYESPRLIEGADSDLRLLAGDYLYALGLERLAARGDLEAVDELADLISLAAQIHAEDEPGFRRRAHSGAVAGGDGRGRRRGVGGARRGQGGAAGRGTRGRRNAVRRRRRKRPPGRGSATLWRAQPSR